MKPLGTITTCFPHVDDETRIILQSIMNKAENYSDFVIRFCEKACSKQSSQLIRYLAYFHAFHIDMYPEMDRIIKSDDMPVYYEPLHLVSRVKVGETVDMNMMYKSLIKAMNEIPNDWLACHLYLEWRRAAESFYPETDTDKQIMETLEKRIKNDDDFACFKPLFIGLEAYGMMMKGYHEDALQTYERGLALARKYDDLPLIADGLCLIAETIRIMDAPRAIEIMQEHNKIAEELGYKWGLARNSLILGWIMLYRGEFNAALNHLLEFRELVDSIGHPSAWSEFVLALIYNLVGDGENAIEYLNSIKDKVDDRKRNAALYYLMFAFAYIKIGNKREASAYLDTAKQLVVRAGFQSYLNWHQLLEGIFEKEQGDFESAMDTFDNLLNRLNKMEDLHRILCLFHLAEIEVETQSPETEDIAESFLNRFETYVEEKDYPGFIAQAKILRVKLLQKQGEHKKAQALVDAVLQVAESPSMAYLKDMIAVHVPSAGC